MAQKTKKSQVAPQTQEVTTTLLCMDAKVTTLNKAITQGDTIDARVTYVDDDHLRIIQNKRQAAVSQPHIDHPELKWRPLAGTLHGKASANANGVMLIMYIRHEDYHTDGRELADILAQEVEQMGEVLAETDMQNVLTQCN